MADTLKVAVAGLGSIGSRVARALDTGIDGLRLSAISASTPERTAAAARSFRSGPSALPLSELPDVAEIIVECLPPSAFGELAEAAIRKGNLTLLVVSAGQLITLPDILDRLAEAAVRVVVPSGALAGLDGLRAAREIGLEEVRLTTRKPLRSFGDQLEVEGERVVASTLTAPVRVFAGNARQSVAAFPKNVNVAATVALAGLGPDATQVELWADPSVAVNTHELYVRSRGGEVTVRCANDPDETNPKSSAITAFSVIAALRRLDTHLAVGS